MTKKNTTKKNRTKKNRRQRGGKSLKLTIRQYPEQGSEKKRIFPPANYVAEIEVYGKNVLVDLNNEEEVRVRDKNDPDKYRRGTITKKEIGTDGIPIYDVEYVPEKNLTVDKFRNVPNSIGDDVQSLDGRKGKITKIKTASDGITKYEAIYSEPNVVRGRMIALSEKNRSKEWMENAKMSLFKTENMLSRLTSFDEENVPRKIMTQIIDADFSAPPYARSNYGPPRASGGPASNRSIHVSQMMSRSKRPASASADATLVTVPFTKEEILKKYNDIVENAKVGIRYQIKKKFGVDGPPEPAAGSGSGDNKTDWKLCKNCKDIENYLQEETETTYYMMNLIEKSIMDISSVIPKSIFIIEERNKSKLNGKWNNDQRFLDLNDELFGQEKSRLVMAFGPSASGKSTIGKSFLSVLKLVDPTLPSIFFQIDGGLAREFSKLYMYIASYYNAGLKIKNLYNDLFQSKKIKQTLENYFYNQRLKGKDISLYVPETLSYCSERTVLHRNVQSIYRCTFEKYIKTANDKNWIGLHIFQCKDDCQFGDEPYKCEGCSDSGRKREKKEGKKYDPNMWQSTYKQGDIELEKAPGGRYKIHNCGRSNGISKIFDYTPSQNKDFSILKNNKYFIYDNLLTNDPKNTPLATQKKIFDVSKDITK